MKTQVLWGFILLCCVIVALDTFSHTYAVPNTNIHQQEIINVSQFQKQINTKYPIVVRSVRDQLPSFFEHTIPNASLIGSLLSPLRVSSHVEVIDPDGKIRTTFNNRTILIQNSGKVRVWLFHPTQQSLLYTGESINGHKISPIPVKDVDKTNQFYPLFKHSSYMEVTLKKHMLLSIPNNWSYYIENSDAEDNKMGETSRTLLATSNTIGSIFHILLS